MKKIFEDTTCLKEDEIRRYIGEESSQEEKHRVEDHLLDCPLCSDAMEGFRRHYNFEESKLIESLKEEVAWEADKFNNETPIVGMQPRRRFPINRIAAAVLLLLLSTAGWQYWKNSSGSNLLNDGNITGNLRSEAGEKVTDKAVLKAVELYEAKQFDAALGVAETILEERPENIEATYYAGLSALKSEQFELAEHYFMTLRLNSDFYFEDATWLMVQACLGADKKEKAIRLLDEIIKKPAGFYYERAKALRATLD